MKPRYTLLAVDDDEDTLQLIAVMLRDSPFTMIAARSGNEALLTARNTPVDIVLLDIIMPDLSGITVCGHLRASPVLRQIPVVVLTARDDYATRRSAMRAGATDLLTKPVTREELLSKLLGVLAEHEAGASWNA